jgi:hypothetical protein
MQPMGKLSGRVMDPAGKPVPDASIWLVWEDRWCKPPACFPFRRQLKAGQKGEYSVTDLEIPGTWLLSATAPLSWKPPEPRGDQWLGWAQTFYPGVTDPQLAEAVMVRPEGEVLDLDFKLVAAPAHRIRGRILDFRGTPVPKASVALAKGFGSNLTQVTDADGTFEFPTVLDGDWRLSAAVNRDGIKLMAAQSVEIRGRDLDNVELRLASPFAVRVKIVTEHAEGTVLPKPPGIDVVLISGAPLLSDEADAYRPAESVGGDLTIRNIYPGSYEIQPVGDSSPYYLDSIRVGAQDALGSEASILSNAEPLTLVYKLGGGTVRGTVEACRGGRVFLIPQDRGLRGAALLRVTGCDQNDRFEFAAVRPGEYNEVAVAWNGPPMLSYAAVLADGDLLKRASRVTVLNNESTSAVISLIPRL